MIAGDGSLGPWGMRGPAPMKTTPHSSRSVARRLTMSLCQGMPEV